MIRVAIPDKPRWIWSGLDSYLLISSVVPYLLLLHHMKTSTCRRLLRFLSPNNDFYLQRRSILCCLKGQLMKMPNGTDVCGFTLSARLLSDIGGQTVISHRWSTVDVVRSQLLASQTNVLISHRIALSHVCLPNGPSFFVSNRFLRLRECHVYRPSEAGDDLEIRFPDHHSIITHLRDCLDVVRTSLLRHNINK